MLNQILDIKGHLYKHFNSSNSSEVNAVQGEVNAHVSEQFSTPQYKCGAAVEYYFKDQKLSCEASESLSHWLNYLNVQSPKIFRVLETIQVLETGRGSIRARIKDVVKHLSQFGFVDEIKSRGLMQMRSNFVIAKMLKLLVLKSPNEKSEAESELTQELFKHSSFMDYVAFPETQETLLDTLIKQAESVESDFDNFVSECLIFDLKQVITFDYSKQFKRNTNRWSFDEIFQLMKTHPKWQAKFNKIYLFNLLYDSQALDLETSKERVCKLVTTVMCMLDRGESNESIMRYVTLKKEILQLIKTRDAAVDEIRIILDNHDGVSVWIANELMTLNLKILQSLASANNEMFDIDNNWIAMRMFLTSYNRGVSKISLSIIQNWIYQFSTMICNPTSNAAFLQINDIDSSFKTNKRREELFRKMQFSFLSTCLEMMDMNLFDQPFTLFDFYQASSLMLRCDNRSLFIQHPVVVSLGKMYELQSGEKLSVTFSESQMQDCYFSYGSKILRASQDLKTLQH